MNDINLNHLLRPFPVYDVLWLGSLVLMVWPARWSPEGFWPACSFWGIRVVVGPELQWAASVSLHSLSPSLPSGLWRTLSACSHQSLSARQPPLLLSIIFFLLSVHIWFPKAFLCRKRKWLLFRNSSMLSGRATKLHTETQIISSCKLVSMTSH